MVLRCGGKKAFYTAVVRFQSFVNLCFWLPASKWFLNLFPLLRERRRLRRARADIYLWQVSQVLATSKLISLYKMLALRIKGKLLLRRMLRIHFKVVTSLHCQKYENDIIRLSTSEHTEAHREKTPQGMEPSKGHSSRAFNFQASPHEPLNHYLGK